LKKYDYRITRQTGIHIRLTSKYTNEEHNIPVHAHNPLKIGTLNNILKEVTEYLGIAKDEIIKNLFG